MLTQFVGHRGDGLEGLAFTIPVAALTALVGVPPAAGHLTPVVLLAALGLALLLSVLPFALEMLALRRMSHTAFGTFTALETAIGAVLGFLVLGQGMAPIQLLGVALVAFAGAAAQRGGGRAPTSRRTRSSPTRRSRPADRATGAVGVSAGKSSPGGH